MAVIAPWAAPPATAVIVTVTVIAATEAATIKEGSAMSKELRLWMLKGTRDGGRSGRWREGRSAFDQFPIAWRPASVILSRTTINVRPPARIFSTLVAASCGLLPTLLCHRRWLDLLWV